MTACANCPGEAQFYVQDPGANAVYYCRRCLPQNLTARANAGEFALPEAPEEPKPRRKRAAK